jgi:8-oxo-dGTP pyrophosphatase MutT (NUDIX family)
VQEIEAATLVIFRQGKRTLPEVLMVVRSDAMRFAGGAAVFPGGSVDDADRELAASIHPQKLDRDEAAHRIAAIRETLEETGLALGIDGFMDAAMAVEARKMLLQEQALAPVLHAYELSLDLDALHPFARWLPRGYSHKRIFDTRFYLADLGTGAVDISVDATENTRLFWITAKEALQKADRGELSLIFPTRRNLERLAGYDSFEAAQKHAERTPIRPITPQLSERDGEPVLAIPEDAGYPVTYEALDRAMRG